MAKKTTKKTATAKSTKRNTKPKKNIKKNEENSFGIMMLIITGLALLIYFASNITVDASVSIENKANLKNEILENTFMISGKTYSSKEDAYNTLKEIPQTMRTNQEVLFVETWSISLEE